jgi:hypothetical protein
MNADERGLKKKAEESGRGIHFSPLELPFSAQVEGIGPGFIVSSELPERETINLTSFFPSSFFPLGPRITILCIYLPLSAFICVHPRLIFF